MTYANQEPSPKEVTQGLCNPLGLQVYTVAVLVERDGKGGLKVIKVYADGLPIGRMYGGVNEGVWQYVVAAGQLAITVKEEPK